MFSYIALKNVFWCACIRFPGHRDLSDSVPDIARTCSGYQFDEELESAISDFAAQTKIDAKERRALNSLTYEDVYWASKIENPLVWILV